MCMCMCVYVYVYVFVYVYVYVYVYVFFFFFFCDSVSKLCCRSSLFLVRFFFVPILFVVVMERVSFFFFLHF